MSYAKIVIDASECSGDVTVTYPACHILHSPNTLDHQFLRGYENGMGTTAIKNAFWVYISIR